MKKNMKYFLVLLVLLFLSISVVNASDNTTTNTTGHTLEKTTTQQVEKVATNTQEEIIQNSNLNKTTKEINKKNTTILNTKTAHGPGSSDIVDAGNFDSFVFNIGFLLNVDNGYEEVTINVVNDFESTVEINRSYVTTKYGPINHHEDNYYLTINGNGHVINCSGNHRFMNTDDLYNIIIKDLTFVNFNTNNNGSVFYNENNMLSFINCTFINNTGNNGGVIYNSNNSTLNITNSTLNNNTASESGGTIFNNGNMTITNSTLTNNNATNGGAITNYYANMTLNNNTLTNNNATESGGAIYNGNANMTLNNNTLTNNNVTTEVDIDNDDTLKRALSSSYSDDVIINIQSDISSYGWNVNRAIKTLTINGKCDKQFSSPL